MGQEIPIAIRITAEVYGHEKVQKLADNLMKISTISGKTTRAIEGLGTVARRTTPYIEGLSKPRMDPDTLAQYQKLKEYVLNAEKPLEEEIALLKADAEERRRIVTKYPKIFPSEADVLKSVNAIENYLNSVKEWEATIGTVTDAHKRLSMQQQLTRRTLEGYSEGLVKQSTALSVLERTTGLSTEANRGLLRAYQQLSGPILSTEDGLNKLSGALTVLKESQIDSKQAWDILGSSLTKVMRSIGFSSESIRGFKTAFGESTDSAIKFLDIQKRLSTPVLTTAESIDKLKGTLTLLKESQIDSKQAWELLASSLTGTMRSIGLSSESIKGLKTAISSNVDTAIKFLEVQQQLSGPVLSATDGIKKLSGALSTLRESQVSTTQAWEVLGPSLTKVMRSIGMTTNQIRSFRTAFSQSIESAQNFLDVNIQLRQPIMSVSQGLSVLGSSLRTLQSQGIESTQVWEMYGGELTNIMRSMGWSTATIRGFRASLEEGTSSALNFLEVQKSLIGPTFTIDQGIRKVSTALDLLSNTGLTSTQMWSYFGTSFTAVLRDMGLGTASIREFRRALEQSPEAAKEVIASLGEIQRSLAEVNMAQRAFRAELGTTGEATRRFGMALLWVGLQGIFTMYSWARLQRTARGIESSVYSLKRAYLSLNEAQKELNEAMAIYGIQSDEYRDAALRYEETQWRVKNAEAALTNAIEQNYLAYAQMVAMFPTYYSAAVQLTQAIWYQRIAQQMANAETEKGAILMPLLGRGGEAAANGIRIMGLSFVQASIGLTLLLMGVNLLIGALAHLIAQRQAADMMRKLRQEMDMGAESAYNFGEFVAERSLTDDLDLLTKKLKETKSALEDIDWSNLPEEVRTNINIGEIPDIAGRVRTSLEITDLKKLEPKDIKARRLESPSLDLGYGESRTYSVRNLLAQNVETPGEKEEQVRKELNELGWLTEESSRESTQKISENVQEQTQETTDWLGNIWNTLYSWGVQIRQFRGIPSGIDQLTGWLTGRGPQTIAERIWNAIQGAKDWLVEHATNLSIAITGGLSSLWTWMSGGLVGLGSTISGKLSDLWSWISGGLNSLGTRIGEFFSPVTETLGSVWDSITSGFTNLGSSLETTLGNIWTGITNLPGNIGSSLETVKNGILGGLGTVKDSIMNFPTWLSTEIGNLWDNITGNIIPSLGDITSKVGQIGTDITSSISGLGTDLINSVQGLGGAIAEALGGIGGSLAEGAEGALATVGNALSSAGQAIMDFFGGLFGGSSITEEIEKMNQILSEKHTLWIAAAQPLNVNVLNFGAMPPIDVRIPEALNVSIPPVEVRIPDLGNNRNIIININNPIVRDEVDIRRIADTIKYELARGTNV